MYGRGQEVRKVGSREPEGLGITEEAIGNMAETLLMNLTMALKFEQVYAA